MVIFSIINLNREIESEWRKNYRTQKRSEKNVSIKTPQLSLKSGIDRQDSPLLRQAFTEDSIHDCSSVLQHFDT